jgi:hypothetical protein
VHAANASSEISAARFTAKASGSCDGIAPRLGPPMKSMQVWC